ncbi:MAG: hypothetical protein HY922_03455 [Elusimicrobia bacterium]|nr:hypothetical protein [Elusimicrobiota bacterium]
MTITEIEKIEREAVQSDISQIALYLQNNIGQKMTAYLSGLKDAKMVGQWVAKKTRPKSDIVDARLREAFKAAHILVQAFGQQTAKAWFVGTNSRLGGQAPAYLLRHSTSIDDIQVIAPVAQAFVRA